MLGEHLRKARKERGLTGAELSALLVPLGVTLSADAIYAFERGDRSVSYKYMKPLIRVLRLESELAWRLFDSAASA